MCDQTSLSALLERSVVLSRLYPEDQEVSGLVSNIQQRTRGNRSSAGDDEPGSRDPVSPSPPVPAPPETPAPDGEAARLVRTGSGWKRLRSAASSLWAMTALLRTKVGWRPLFNQIKTNISSLSWAQRGALAAICLVAMGVAFWIARPKPIPPTLVSVRFVITPSDSKILVDGQALTEGAASLAQALIIR